MFDVVEHDFCKRRRIQLSFETKKRETVCHFS